MFNVDINKQLEIIKRGTVDIISEDELIQKLKRSEKEGCPLRIKAGFDPTAPDLHLGHTILLRKLRQFQDLGHQVYFLIGDFTGRIGDPSGSAKIRKQLSKEEVSENAATYKRQISQILNIDKIQIVFNSEWFEKMSVLDMLKLTSQATISQMLARADFKKRLSRNENISLLEFMYPLLQGYDSVILEADIELGGTDQIFNLLVGRDIQKDFGQPQQVIITLPLLEGTDGKQKMSKSYGNSIGINESPSEMLGKLMSISDELMLKYYELLTDEDAQVIKKMHPKEAKLNLAQKIVEQYHSQKEGVLARLEFERVFSQKELPPDIPEYKIDAKQTIISVLLNSGLVKSGNEARRLVRQGAVFFDNAQISREDFLLQKSGILKVGARRFLKVII